MTVGQCSPSYRYVVTNDSIQETEFKFLRRLKENAKPLIILLNVHKNFRDSRRGPYELERFLKNPDKLFAIDGSSGLGGHIERICRYARQHYGNDYFKIVPVMLLAAQLSYEPERQPPTPFGRRGPDDVQKDWIKWPRHASLNSCVSYLDSGVWGLSILFRISPRLSIDTRRSLKAVAVGTTIRLSRS